MRLARPPIGYTVRVMRRRLHVKVSRQCNNHCLFCLDDKELRADVDQAEVAELLAQHAHLGELLFTCGEPTLHPDLPRFVAMARDAGYTSIGLVTNGRRLSYPAYAQSLVHAGLTEVTVSIHGDEPRLHDSLTRTRGSFEQTAAGLRNAVQLRAQHPLRVISSTVVVRHNLPHLRRVLEFLTGIGVDVMVCNVVEPSGEALRHLERVAPSYTDIAAGLRLALDDLPGRDKVVVEGIPVCLCDGFRDRLGVREQIHLRDGDDVRALPPDRHHIKPQVCEGCGWTGVCPGVFEAYARRRGTDELAPRPPGQAPWHDAGPGSGGR
jgi:MoaA/NifB/PqqE/SkfB family radical SAM enzyme